MSRGREKQFIEHFEIRLVIYYIKYISSGREMRYAVHVRTLVDIRRLLPDSKHMAVFALKFNTKVSDKNDTSCGKMYSLENSHSFTLKNQKQPCQMCLSESSKRR